MNALRLAELTRRQAALFEELALVAREIADVLAGREEEAPAPANDTRRPPVREPYTPPPREVAPIARARAKRGLTRIGER